MSKILELVEAYAEERIRFWPKGSNANNVSGKALAAEVEKLEAELEEARKDAARYRWLRERDDWVLMPGMRNEGYMRSCLDDQIDLSMGAFIGATK